MCEQLTANKQKIQINTISFFFSVVKRMVLTVALAARMLNCRKGSFYLISPLFFFSLTSDQFSAARSSDRRFKIVQKQKIGNSSEAENVWTRSRRQYLHRISLMAKITTEYLFPRVTILPINNSRSALNCFLFASVTTSSRPWSANKTFLGLLFSISRPGIAPIIIAQAAKVAIHWHIWATAYRAPYTLSTAIEYVKIFN